ncbi:MAG: TonB-dependent receptor [Bacteroidales bacterium]|nr:TonB-dependent receptor [Bacteroidales bacterium]
MMKYNSTLTGILVALLGFQLQAQATLTGKVLDAETTTPLIGATVLIEGTTTGTITDANGEFILEHSNGFPLTLLFRYIGYEERQIQLLKNKVPDVYMLPSSAVFKEVTVTARRRIEGVQKIPIPISVLNARQIDNSVSFNVNRVKELIPSVQLYSSNPRNTTLNIRGIGSTFGLTNDGIDPGVGFYVDGVYYARPASTVLDFIDVEQIEVLRGPQGTLFGKNTTAGAFNITSRKPTFVPSAIFEHSFGNYGFNQSKVSISGPLLSNKLAARLSYSGTNRDGTIYNVATEKYTNTMNNQGFRGQLLYLPGTKTRIILSADYTRQRPDGYAHVLAGVVPTLRPAYRQFENIIADLDYEPPSRNPFDRLIDHDTPARSDQDMGGVALNADVELGHATLTATSGWRYWKWGPSSDRDFTGLSAIRKSQAPSIHHQWSQEVRVSGDFSRQVSGTIGAFAFYQKLDADGSHTLEAGSDQWRFVQNSLDPLWQTPGLFDGLKQETHPSFRNFSGALYGQVDWMISGKFIVTPGLRINYDWKKVDFTRTVSGGLVTSDPSLIALKNRVFKPLSFRSDIDDLNFSGQFGMRYEINNSFRVYGNYSLGFKPVGLNLGGIPTENGEPLLDLTVIKPEQVSHFEFGFKSEPNRNNILNVTVFNTDIYNYQTTVRSAEPGEIRGYLANAEHVRTRGAEIEGMYNLDGYLRLNASVIFTDGRYVKFENAPVPLEETGGNDFKDISGGLLPGISRWSYSAGAEAYSSGRFLGNEGEYFIASDVFYRSSFSSNPTPSAYLNVAGYTLINARIGYRTHQGITLFMWARNIADTDYFEQLLAAGGNAGHYAGVLGDPRTYGITIRYKFN